MSLQRVVAGVPYWEGRIAGVPVKDEQGYLVFEDFPFFMPNLTPEEVIRSGAFGGTYFREIKSKTAGKTFRVGVHLEFPDSWFEGLDTARMVTSSEYDATVNLYRVKSGNDLSFWESKGWIVGQDPYGWFQWYCRFYLGRRTDDDERQVSRWCKAAGAKGRWRSFLVGQCVKSNLSWNDTKASPVTRQTLLHWAYALTQEDFEKIAGPVRKGKSVVYLGKVVQQPKKKKARVGKTKMI